MVRASCFVPGCISGRLCTLKRNQEKGIRNPSMFKPHDLTALEKWKMVIGRKDKVMTMKDQVCEFHFEEDSISRHYEHKLSDGSTFKLERGVPRLTPDAIPSSLLLENTAQMPIKEYIINHSKYLNSKNKSTLFRPICPKMNVKSPIIESAVIDNSESVDFQEENVVSCPPECLLQFTKSDIKINNYSRQLTKMLTNTVVSPPVIDQGSAQFCFEYLVFNVDKVIKPSDTWAVSVINEFFKKYVVCAKWCSHVPEKRIVIESDLNVFVYLKDKDISTGLNIAKVNSMDDVANLLRKVHFLVICPGIDDKNRTDCELYLERPFGAYGRPKTCCRPCHVTRLKQREARKKKNPEAFFRSHPVLLNRVRVAEKRNSRLLKTVITLKNCLSNSRHQCALAVKDVVKNAVSSLSLTSSQQKALWKCIKASRLHNGQAIQYKVEDNSLNPNSTFRHAMDSPTLTDVADPTKCAESSSCTQLPIHPQHLKKEYDFEL